MFCLDGITKFFRKAIRSLEMEGTLNITEGHRFTNGREDNWFAQGQSMGNKVQDFPYTVPQHHANSDSKHY
jgi:hypothetical protein